MKPVRIVKYLLL